MSAARLITIGEPLPRGLAGLVERFGDPLPYVNDKPRWEALTLATRPLPTALVYAYGPQRITRVRAHRLLVDHLVETLMACLASGVSAERLVYGGAYCWRAKRRAEMLSTHCLVGDSLVTTPAGPVPIAELHEGDSLFTYPAVETRSVSRVFAPRHEPTRTIRTRTRALTASDEHPFLVLRGNTVGRGKKHDKRYWTEWVTAQKLRLGDWLILAQRLPTPSATGELGPLEAEVIGAFLGDGNVVHRRTGVLAGVAFSIPASDGYRERAAVLLEECFRLPPRVNAYGLYYDRAAIAQWFVDRGVDHPARDKFVPPAVWRASEVAQLAFLRGYICTDGCVTSSGGLAFKAGSERLICEVRALCLSLGFGVSNVQAEEGGPRLIKGVATVSRRQWRFSARDRRGVLTPLHHGRHDARLLERRSHLRRHRHGRSRGRGSAWLPQGFGVESVAAIADAGRREVYDLTVDADHNFIAEGLVVSNCWGIAIDLDPANNPMGTRWRNDGSMLDERIISTFLAHGWYWGDTFRDPQHWQFCVDY